MKTYIVLQVHSSREYDPETEDRLDDACYLADEISEMVSNSAWCQANGITVTVDEVANKE